MTTTANLQGLIDEQAERLLADWHSSLQYKSDKAAARIDGYDEMSPEDQHDIGTAVMRRYCSLLAGQPLLAN